MKALAWTQFFLEATRNQAIMHSWNSIGYLASALVLTAFCMKEIVPLRLISVCSNVAFLIYGVALGLLPVWLLHAVLLPINVWRLRQAYSPSFKAKRSSDTCPV